MVLCLATFIFPSELPIFSLPAPQHDSATAFISGSLVCSLVFMMSTFSNNPLRPSPRNDINTCFKLLSVGLYVDDFWSQLVVVEFIVQLNANTHSIPGLLKRRKKIIKPFPSTSQFFLLLCVNLSHKPCELHVTLWLKCETILDTI